MKLIYIAGPYRPYTDQQGQWHGTPENIYKAEKTMIEWLKRGWSVICPHKNTAHLDHYEKHLKVGSDYWLQVDFEIIRRCDAIAIMKNWTFSDGTLQELELAKKHNLEIYYQQLNGEWTHDESGTPDGVRRQD